MDLTERLEQLARLEDGQRRLSLADALALAREAGLTLHDVEVAAVEAHVLPARYARNLGTVGWDGQQCLLQATVGVVGCGGLGGWVIEGLARMGVGYLIVIDCDAFEENNLNRQLLCTEATLGQPKVLAAQERVGRVNQSVTVTAHHVRATAENLPTLLAGAQVVVDALDTIPMRLALQDAAAALGIPMVHGAIAGYVGQVTTIFPGDIGLRALYGTGDVPERGIETQWGNPAATPMMVAAWQVQEVVKVLTGRGEPLRNRLLYLDAEAGHAEVFSLA
ncbi:MAG: HesA/MoeB/ThiF family protein [Chloroflexi bacterium]|nr:HesA/MoeB/ThiF family protein [Chloroflexota bacterium]MBU1749895.1 HesA/MoeB/ThiF family protein [Chloroflexota bacterium]MBU1879641.1 HesA/MoeB/ThiF family protein [Chloroflexota bacterium]